MSHHSNDPDAQGGSRGTTDGHIEIWDVAMLASKFKLTRIVVLGQSEKGAHVATWGKNLGECALAAEVGNSLRTALAIDPEVPNRVKRLQELALENEKLRQDLDRLQRKVKQQIERAMGFNGLFCKSEDAERINQTYRKWLEIDP